MRHISSVVRIVAEPSIKPESRRKMVYFVDSLAGAHVQKATTPICSKVTTAFQRLFLQEHLISVEKF